MMSNKELIDSAIRTISIEATAIERLSGQLDNQFAEVIKRIYKSEGRVVITGIGKSANIGQKIVATLNSTGTPSLFMHAADAIHGDLGNIQKNDVIICISKSGNTTEIKVLLPLIRKSDNLIVGITGDRESYLGKNADLILDTYVEKEACPNNLAPTSSTTAQLVMGDAIAVCLLEARGFSKEDFARFHPGGALGKKLYLRVQDILISTDNCFVVQSEGIRKTIISISSSRVGAVAVFNDTNKIIGIITDGDIRRMMENKSDFTNIKAHEIMGVNPKCIETSELAINALALLKDNNISQIIVTSEGEFSGIIHFQDLLREGIV